MLCKSVLISAIDTAYMERLSELTLLPKDSSATHFIRHDFSVRISVITSVNSQTATSTDSD